MTPFVLLIGLGVHATFEGIALGLTDDFKETALFALAIFLHKGAAGMSLGIAMGKAFPERERFIMGMIALFAIFTPLGIVIGMLLQQTSDIVEVVFNCIAAGTFLYIACSEVIIEEFSLPENKYIKLFFFLIGIALITCLRFIEE